MRCHAHIEKYWREIGLELELKKTDLEIIDCNAGSSSRGTNVCFRGMCNKWLETKVHGTCFDWIEAVRQLSSTGVIPLCDADSFYEKVLENKDLMNEIS